MLAEMSILGDLYAKVFTECMNKTTSNTHGELSKLREQAPAAIAVSQEAAERAVAYVVSSAQDAALTYQDNDESSKVS
tara:strand:- start:10848 stop:11081 length:234 start_codon:yes stop_codon:yes gene_type:complete